VVVLFIFFEEKERQKKINEMEMKAETADR
jgi:hypothetical protein